MLNEEESVDSDFSDFFDKTLEIRLICGNSLHKSENDNSKIYVEFTIGKRSVCSSAISNTFDPEWNENLNLAVSESSIKSITLIIRVIVDNGERKFEVGKRKLKGLETKLKQGIPFNAMDLRLGKEKKITFYLTARDFGLVDEYDTSSEAGHVQNVFAKYIAHIYTLLQVAIEAGTNEDKFNRVRENLDYKVFLLDQKRLREEEMEFLSKEIDQFENVLKQSGYEETESLDKEMCQKIKTNLFSDELLFNMYTNFRTSMGRSVKKTSVTHKKKKNLVRSFLKGTRKRIRKVAKTIKDQKESKRIERLRDEYDGTIGLFDKNGLELLGTFSDSSSSSYTKARLFGFDVLYQSFDLLYEKERTISTEDFFKRIKENAKMGTNSSFVKILGLIRDSERDNVSSSSSSSSSTVTTTTTTTFSSSPSSINNDNNNDNNGNEVNNNDIIDGNCNGEKNQMKKFICEEMTQFRYVIDGEFITTKGGKSLRNFLSDHYLDLDQESRIEILFQVLNSLRFLHKNGIFHGFLSLDNIYVVENANNKLDEENNNPSSPINASPASPTSSSPPTNSVNTNNLNQSSSSSLSSSLRNKTNKQMKEMDSSSAASSSDDVCNSDDYQFKVILDEFYHSLFRKVCLVQKTSQNNKVFLPPEYLIKQDVNESVDMFSFGILCYFVIGGVLRNSYYQEYPNQPSVVLMSTFPSLAFKDVKVEPWLAELITRCVSVYPEKRPSCEEIFEAFNGEMMKKRPAIEVYTRTIREDDADAEEMLLTEFSYQGLANALVKHFGMKRELEKIYWLTNETNLIPIEADKDVWKLEESSMVVVKFGKIIQKQTTKEPKRPQEGSLPNISVSTTMTTSSPSSPSAKKEENIGNNNTDKEEKQEEEFIEEELMEEDISEETLSPNIQPLKNETNNNNVVSSSSITISVERSSSDDNNETISSSATKNNINENKSQQQEDLFEQKKKNENMLGRERSDEINFHSSLVGEHFLESDSFVEENLDSPGTNRVVGHSNSRMNKPLDSFVEESLNEDSPSPSSTISKEKEQMGTYGSNEEEKDIDDDDEEEEKDPIVIYLRSKEEDDEEAEDFLLDDFTISEVRSLVFNKWEDANIKSLYVKKDDGNILPLTCNKDMRTIVEEDDVVIVEFISENDERDEQAELKKSIEEELRKELKEKLREEVLEQIRKEVREEIEKEFEEKKKNEMNEWKEKAEKLSKIIEAQSFKIEALQKRLGM